MSALSIRNMNRSMDLRDQIAVDRIRQFKQKRELDAILKAIRPFFTAEMWDKFVDAGPDGNTDFLQYVKDEWYRIAKEFEVIA